MVVDLSQPLINVREMVRPHVLDELAVGLKSHSAMVEPAHNTPDEPQNASRCRQAFNVKEMCEHKLSVWTPINRRLGTLLVPQQRDSGERESRSCAEDRVLI